MRVKFYGEMGFFRRLGKGYMGLEIWRLRVEERVIWCFRRVLGDFGVLRIGIFWKIFFDLIII